jgi:Flp pilus assembly protein TadG
MRALHRFATDTGGNVLMMFGLAAVPLIGLMGASIDYAVASQRRLDIQVALDQATLAVAREPPVDNDQLAIRVKQFMSAQLSGKGIPASEWQLTQATEQEGRVTTAATSVVKNRFSGILQMPTVTIATNSEVARGQGKLEVALVLDNTGSMGNGTGRIEALRTAATELVNSLYANAGASDKVKVALVPFVTTVNVKADNVFNWSWIDGRPTDATTVVAATSFEPALATHHGENLDPPAAGGKTNHLKLLHDLQREWKGCVEARAEPYDLDDTPPDINNPDTLYVPWFWPDEPDSGINYSGGTAYTNNYMPDDYTRPSGTPNSATAAARQRNTSKYKNKRSQASIDETPSVTSGPNKSCPDRITPLTNDVALMNQRITAMMPWSNSGTNVAMGMVWGWGVLSPTPPFTEGAPYEDKQNQKAMIVLTDGENEVSGGWDTHNKSDYTGYNYLAKNRFGTTNRADAVAEINNKVTTLCNKIKAKGIRLYTITFQLNSASGQALYRNCATKPELYYNSPSTSELRGVFKKIAADLSNLRFSK